MPSRPLRTRTFFRLIVFFLAYFLTAELGTYLRAAGTYPALIWPPAGIALAGLILGGIELWPAIALASLLQFIVQDSTPLMAITIAAANTLQALIGLYFLKKVRFTIRFERLYDAFVFCIVALFVSMVVPTIGILTDAVLGTAPIAHLGSVWGPWWTGELLSLLVITPVVLRWMPRPRSYWNHEEITEATIAFLFLVAVDVFLYWTPYTSIESVSLTYVTLVPLFWIGLRMGPRATTLALLVNAFAVLAGTAFGYGVTHGVFQIGPQLLQSEIYLIIISVIFLILVSIAEERKQATDTLRNNVQRLENAFERISREDTAKSEFIATLAHELRNPLAPLVSAIDIMKLGELPAKDRIELIGSMSDSITTMRRLLNDLLDISRISQRKLTLQKEVIDLKKVIDRGVHMAEPVIKEYKHSVTISYPEDTILVEADLVRLEQVVVNLLNNAAKYTDPGGAISLRVESTPGAVAIRVKDTGIGIDRAMLKNIFDPFVQVERGERKMGGLGIGLSLTSSLVEMHGGTIEARSEGLGKGSEFIVRLPYLGIEENNRVLRQGAERHALLPSFMRPNFTILVVDDNQTAAKALQKLLTLRGYDVTIAFNGSEALERVPQTNPRVVLLDIGLPDMSGYEVARRLREEKLYGGTLVALTGYGQDSDKETAGTAGFDHHLTKPAGLAEIEAILNQL